MLDMTDGKHILERAIDVQQIPSPTFEEHERAAHVAQSFDTMEIVDTQMDDSGNVYAHIAGGNDKPILVTAHLDTVFPRETDLTIQRHKERVYGPGLGDNALGVAALITLAEILNVSGWCPPGDLWLVANVAEEGLGDLQGMRRVMGKLGNHVGATIVLEGTAFGRIYNRGVGSQRYLIQAKAAGGHPWENLGSSNAIHILVELARRITNLHVPDRPQTSLNIGRIRGGTSINTIAQDAELELDLRSDDRKTLAQISEQVETMINQTISDADASVTFEVCGSRPSGQIQEQHPLVQLAIHALQQVGCDKAKLDAGSTDANIPLSQDLPAICIGLTTGGNQHRPDEFITIEPIARGMKQLLLVALGAYHWME